MKIHEIWFFISHLASQGWGIFFVFFQSISTTLLNMMLFKKLYAQ